MVYVCFVAKMSEMAFTRFGGQFQFEKSMLGRLDNSGAGLPGDNVVVMMITSNPQPNR